LKKTHSVKIILTLFSLLPVLVHAAAIRLSPANMETKLVKKFALSFFQDESGASAAEYAVLLTLVTVVLIAAVTTLGTAISAIFAKVATTLANAA
jgi:pilus assembly protein Flp/PilA